MDEETKQYLESEVKRWKYLVELFSDRDGRVIINNSNVTAEYRDWANSHLRLTEARLKGGK